MKQITIGCALIIAAIAITVIVFLKNWHRGMVLQFFREGHPFDRFALVLFALVFFPPLVERMGLPGILGLILGGVLLDPYVLGIGPKSSEVGMVTCSTLAALGAHLICFTGGGSHSPETIRGLSE